MFFSLCVLYACNMCPALECGAPCISIISCVLFVPSLFFDLKKPYILFCVKCKIHSMEALFGQFASVQLHTSFSIGNLSLWDIFGILAYCFHKKKMLLNVLLRRNFTEILEKQWNMWFAIRRRKLNMQFDLLTWWGCDSFGVQSVFTQFGII